MPLLDDLFALSENTALFDHLRNGRPPTALPASPVPLVVALRANDATALQTLIAAGDTCDRVLVLGELILTLHALTAGGHAGEPADAIQKVAQRLALDLATELEANPPQDADDPELLAHGVALREWAHLLAGYYKATGVPAYEAEMLMVRARVTNTTLSVWAHLVGAAMVEIARALEPLGNVKMAAQCYHGVRMDLRYLLTREDAYPDHERGVALYWLQQACEARLRLIPDDKGAQADLREVRELRERRGFRDAASAPRFGPIARTYLDRIPYLALIIRDVHATYGPDRPDENGAAICDRYGCLMTDVEFYSSAIGSYGARRLLAGVHMIYDAAHEEVFAAIEYLEKT